MLLRDAVKPLNLVFSGTVGAMLTWMCLTRGLYCRPRQKDRKNQILGSHPEQESLLLICIKVQHGLAMALTVLPRIKGERGHLSVSTANVQVDQILSEVNDTS